MLYHLSYEHIVRINAELIERYGGLGPAVVNRGSLEHVLQATTHRVFDTDRYATLEEKAAAIVDAIVRRHVFSDGNKRTGAMVLVVLLELNGIEFSVSNEELATTIEDLAAGQLDYDTLLNWIRAKIS